MKVTLFGFIIIGKKLHFGSDKSIQVVCFIFEVRDHVVLSLQIMQQPPNPTSEMEDDPESSQDGQNGTGLPSLLSMKLDVPPDVGSQELKLPQALEQALAFKSERAKEIGVSAEDEDGELMNKDFSEMCLLMFYEI